MKRSLFTLAILLLPGLASAQIVNWGDYVDTDQTIYMYFNTVGTDGVAETLAGTPDVCIYEDGSVTQIDAGGETLSASFDSVTGFNQVSVDLSNAAYETGKTYTVVIDAGTVDSVSAVGRIVGVFSVGRYSSSTDITTIVDARADTTDGLINTAQVDIDSILDDTGTSGVLVSDGTGAGQLNLTSGVVDANAVQLSGDSTAADNLEDGYDNGYGYGDLVFRSTVSSVTSAGSIIVQMANTASANSFGVGARVVVRDVSATGVYTGIVESYDGLELDIDADGTVPFTIATGDIIEIIAPGYGGEDRTRDTAIKTKTDFLPSATAGAAGGVFIAGSNAATSITTGLTSSIIGNITGNLSGSVGSVTLIPGATSGTSDSGTTTTMVDAARTEVDTDYWKGDAIVFTSGTLAGQTRVITGFNTTSDTITFAPATTVAAGTHTYQIVPWAEVRPVDGSLTEAKFDAGVLFDPQTDTVTPAANSITSSVLAADAIGASEIAADAIGASELATDAIGAAELAADSIAASEIATDAIGAAELAADAITNAEIAASAIGSSELATDSITSDEIAASAVTELSTAPALSTRDLRPVAAVNTWRMVQTGSGVVSANTVTIYQGETKRCSFDCVGLLPGGEVLADMATPTASVANLTPTEVGIDARHAKITLACGAAVAAGTYNVRTTISTDPDTGPILIIGTVKVLED